MTTTTNTGSFRQNGRDVALAERGALRKWLVMTVAIRSAGDSESDAYKSARSESCEGYVERGGSANAFKSKLSNCNVILDRFSDLTVAQISAQFTSVPDAYRAAKAPVDGDGNHVVTTKSPAERIADVRSAARLALGAGVSLDDILAAVKDEAAKLA